MSKVNAVLQSKTFGSLESAGKWQASQIGKGAHKHSETLYQCDNGKFRLLVTVEWRRQTAGDKLTEIESQRR